MIDRQQLAADLEKLVAVAAVGMSDASHKIDETKFINVKVDCAAFADHMLGMFNAFVQRLRLDFPRVDFVLGTGAVAEPRAAEGKRLAVNLELASESVRRAFAAMLAAQRVYFVEDEPGEASQPDKKATLFVRLDRRWIECGS